MWNNVDIVSRACLQGSCKTKPTAGALVPLVALCGRRWRGEDSGWVGVPAACEVPGRGRNSTSHFAGNGIRHQEARSQRYMQGQTGATPEGVWMVWEKEKCGNKHCQGWCNWRDAPSCCRGQPTQSKGTQAVTSLAHCRQNVSNHFPSSLLLALLME